MSPNTLTPTVARLPRWPLMRNNLTRPDLQAVIELLQSDDPVLTQSTQVSAFEREWSEWLGVRHSVMVNSGSSANLITMAAIAERFGPGEIIVPTLTWVSDIASVLHAGCTPVFVDIDPRTLGADPNEIAKHLSRDTRAVFLTHVLGYNALTHELLELLRDRKIALIEDVCESHGATFDGRKLGTFGLASNFSFYYAHHMTTVEGGMVSTNDSDLYERLRMWRAHGMVRESTSRGIREDYRRKHDDLNPDFIFAAPGYNVRSTEIQAVLGRSQLRRLDERNELRRRNLTLFLERLNPEYYRTNFVTEGSSNYAFTLVLRRPDVALRDRVMRVLDGYGVEYRRGTSGGGNQLRQPYLRARFPEIDPTAFPNVDHVHFFGFYIGNYPDLEPASIRELCAVLNEIAAMAVAA
jgi:CDP-4-dehydro-6-deoxyglucose reductase, E1